MAAVNEHVLEQAAPSPAREAVGPGTADLEQVGSRIQAELEVQPRTVCYKWIIPRVGGVEAQVQAHRNMGASGDGSTT